MNGEMDDYEMLNKEIKEALITVCKNHCYQNTESVIVPEPYIPYIPENWNRILVLAESQNIEAGDKYDKWLNEHKTKPRELMTRLEQKPYGDNRIGIGPWDGGEDDEIVKFTLRVIFKEADLGLKVEDVAVSNAVPWTKKRSGSSNERPDEEMLDKAKSFWKEIFEVWNPKIKMLVVLGNMAKEVMNGAGILKKYKGQWLKLRHPSRINLVSGMFDCDDLLRRFPEVQKALGTVTIDKNKPKNKQYENKVFYACHAVSLGVDKFKSFGA